MHMEGIIFLCLQTKDIIEYLKRLSKTSIPDGIIKFIGVSKWIQSWFQEKKLNCFEHTCESISAYKRKLFCG